MCKGFGFVIGHPDIRLDRPKLFRIHGVHLSDLGLELFLRDLQRGLHVVVDEVGEKGT